ncbi:MAG: DNA-binding domain-containing protein [Halobacteriovoraceae bacterium]|nr:DNA-binding domain-containing protein [Halobacteriovoraceae bacterium]
MYWFKNDLFKFQKKFLNLISSEESSLIRDIDVCGSLSHGQALSIYKNNYYKNLINALNDTYEACCKLLSRKVFAGISRSYIEENPLKVGDIALYGESFPQYLKDKWPVKEFPFLYELALLELKIRNVFLDCKRIEKIKINHPVHQIWSSLLYKEEDIKPLDDKKNLLISREEEKIFFKLL